MTQNFRPIPSELKSGLIEVASNIWTIEAKDYVHYRPPMQPRYPYTHRSVVIRLNDNSLLILSPIQLTPDIRTEINALGVVKYLVSPNHLHHLYMGDWQQAYPKAKLYASPRLVPKRKDLTFDKTLSTDTFEPEWIDQIEQCVFGSGNGWFDEIVFFHCESHTVVFTDMIMDFEPTIFSPISRMTTRWNQMYKNTPFGVQLAHTFDRVSLRDSLKTVRTWKPKHLIVAHSPWLCLDEEEQVANFLDSAFNWLEPQPFIVEAIMTATRFSMLLFIVLPIHALIVLIADLIYPRLMGQGGSK
ncbi:conserved hypothetical protein [Hyella patelloides LEGE 07179]|uniref:DUF4336 domain-containing protein n=1 Tax=Hyella patelloides LEGE 07179 TaxID=945734 RepID=A0A563W1P9_9CYAN|nr:conserved hypothetical protein [Hyella patelloides LEGE 07179]